MLFNGGVVSVSFVWPVFSSLVYIVVQTNIAPNAFRTSTTIPQNITLFAMDQVCDQPGLDVSITVRQIRCDKFVVFSTRQVCIIKLEIPRCD